MRPLAQSSALDTPPLRSPPRPIVDAVLRTMTAGRFRHVPVVEGGRLIGIVSIGDLVKAERNDYRGVIETLESQLLDA